VHDKEKVEKLDQVEKDKKKRYEIKYDIDNFYRNKSIAADLQKEIHKHPILSYERYKHEDARGYDIINLDKKNERDFNEVRLKDKETSWQKIVNNLDGIITLYNFQQKKAKLISNLTCTFLKIRGIQCLITLKIKIKMKVISKKLF